MALLTKTVDKLGVTGSEIFVYTFQVSYSDLTQPSQNGEVTDFFPTYIQYALPAIEGPIRNIIQTPIVGGTNVTLQFGAVTAGTTFSFTVACYFGPGRMDGSTFTNTGILYADSVVVAEGTVPTGNDVPSGGYSDSTYDGRTGTWNENVMTFTLPTYHGVRYEIIFKATVNTTLLPGETFTNTASLRNRKPDRTAIGNHYKQSGSHCGRDYKNSSLQHPLRRCF